LARTDVFLDQKTKQQCILLNLDDHAACAFDLKEAPWTVELGSDQRRVTYLASKTALLQRLDDHGEKELAERMRAASLARSDTPEEDMDQEDEDLQDYEETDEGRADAAKAKAALSSSSKKNGE
jgi:hypothetical protein